MNDASSLYGYRALGFGHACLCQQDTLIYPEGSTSENILDTNVHVNSERQICPVVSKALAKTLLSVNLLLQHACILAGSHRRSCMRRWDVCMSVCMCAQVHRLLSWDVCKTQACKCAVVCVGACSRNTRHT